MPPVTAQLNDYAELHCLSNFSFLRGASYPAELVAQAKTLGYRALALTDECSLAGVVRAHVEAKRLHFPLIIGSSFVVDGPPQPLDLVILAQSREGYGHLSELITLARRRAAKGEYRVLRDDLAAPADPIHAHLRHMPDCLVILAPRYGCDRQAMLEQARWVVQTFGPRAWIGLTQMYRARDDNHRQHVHAAAEATGLPVVALGQAEMHVRSRQPVHDVLTAIRLGTPVARCGHDLASNAEHHLRPRLRIAQLYSPDAMAQTLEIARRCNFSLEDLRYEYPTELTPPGMSQDAYLRRKPTWARPAAFRRACQTRSVRRSSTNSR